MATPARVSAVVVGRSLRGGWELSVIGKRTLAVTRGHCDEAATQITLVEEPRFATDGKSLAHDSDLLLERTMVDVVVDGCARAPDRVGEFEAIIRVGEFERRLHAQGDRRCERGPTGDLRFTPPDIVEKVSLSWEFAYGGFDAPAYARYGSPMEKISRSAGIPSDPRFSVYGYPRNPVGRGYLIEASEPGLRACQLPNLEEPRALLTPETLVCEYARRWPSMPMVACPGWLSYNAFPRAVYLGLPPSPYDLDVVRPEDFFEVRAGWLRPEAVSPMTPIATRLDARVRQSSAMGMRTNDVSPGAAVSLTHMHPRERIWSFRLPAETPRMYVRLPGGEPIELTPKIRTVLLEPDEDRVCLVWVGELRLESPIAPDQLEKVEHAVIWNGAGR